LRILLQNKKRDNKQLNSLLNLDLKLS